MTKYGACAKHPNESMIDCTSCAMENNSNNILLKPINNNDVNIEELRGIFIDKYELSNLTLEASENILISIFNFFLPHLKKQNPNLKIFSDEDFRSFLRTYHLTSKWEKFLIGDIEQESKQSDSDTLYKVPIKEVDFKNMPNNEEFYIVIDLTGNKRIHRCGHIKSHSNNFKYVYLYKEQL